MQVLLVADGTVPVVAARVFMTDGDNLPDQAHGGDEWDVRMFRIADNSRYVGILWGEFEGFEVFGFQTVEEGLDWLHVAPVGWSKDPIEDISDGHQVTTYHGRDEDDEMYAHLVKLS